MRKTLRSVLVVMVVLCMATCMLSVPVAATESADQIRARLETLREEKAELDTQIAELNGDIDANFSEIEEIVTQKDRVDQQIALLNQQLANINKQITECSLLVADKQEVFDEAQSHLEQLRGDSKARIRAMEKNGKISYWSVLFQANSFTDLLDRLQMIEQIAEADEAQIQELTDAAAAVEEAKIALETELTALDAAKSQMELTQQELDAKRLQSEEILRKLVDMGLEYEALLETAEDKITQLEESIAKAEAEYQNAMNPTGNDTTPSPDTPNSGGWLVPCRYSAFTSAFGYRVHPISGDWRMHNGVDLAGSTGTAIYASRSGTVTTAAFQAGGAGNYVSINHGDGYASIYMHMTNYIVYAGQHVEQGQVIGYMGNTGGSKGTHLHFGISYNGNYVNPANYINI